MNNSQKSWFQDLFLACRHIVRGNMRCQVGKARHKLHAVFWHETLKLCFHLKINNLVFRQGYNLASNLRPGTYENRRYLYHWLMISLEILSDPRNCSERSPTPDDFKISTYFAVRIEWNTSELSHWLSDSLRIRVGLIGGEISPDCSKFEGSGTSNWFGPSSPAE